MITINLLPQDLRRTERKIVLPYKTFVAGAFAFLVLLHLFLFSLAIIKNVQLFALKRNWYRVEPQSKDSVSTRNEIKALEADIKSRRGVLSRRASLAEILSSLNAAVPRGLWLERFSLAEDGGLVIQGSVVSLTQNEMTIIGKFLQDLKGNKTFSGLFSKIELNSVQRRTIKTYDVVDFVLVGEPKK